MPVVEPDLLPAGVGTTDPLAAQQWHLVNTGQAGGTAGIDAGLAGIWPEYTGQGVLVGVIDDGIDAAHPDLRDAFSLTLGWDARSNDADPRAGTGDRHGTAVAGVIAAAANGQDVVGVAYGATLVGYRASYANDGTPAMFAQLVYRAAEVDVVNASWAYVGFFQDSFSDSRYAPFQTGLQHGTETGRDGLGSIYVFAAGNSRQSGDSTSLHDLQNSPMVITVAGIDRAGRVTTTSTPGPAILVCAPGQDMLTTDRVGSAGYASGNTVTVSGTSFAAPVVSGVVALMLDANDALGWRDVHEILALSARPLAATATSWITNAAVETWNGGGLRFSDDYGFGLVDGHAAVRLAETWLLDGHAPRTTANQAQASVASGTLDLALPDIGTLVASLVVTAAIDIDKIEVALNLRHSWIGDLRIALVSPSGTVSWLFDRPGLMPNEPSAGSLLNDIRATVSSNAFWGEEARGIWTLRVIDAADQGTGVLENWSLTVLGDAASINDTLVLTDAITLLAPSEQGRRSIGVADGGRETLNAAALTLDASFDLATGAAMVGGTALGITAGTVIATVLSGDGDDTLTGSARDETFMGGRGQDIIDGGLGTDTARYLGAWRDFDWSWDIFALSGPHATWLTLTDRSGREGPDRLIGIETLVFEDVAIAVASLYTAAPTPFALAQVAFSNLGPGAPGPAFAAARGVSETYDGGELALPGVARNAQADVTYRNEHAVEIVVRSAWNSIKNVTVNDEDGGEVRIANVVDARVVVGGGTDSVIDITDVKRGSVTSGAGDDTVIIAAKTGGGTVEENLVTIDTGAGDDSITLAGDRMLTRSVIEGGAGNDTITVLGDGADRIGGGAGADVIRAGGGADTLTGGTGNDLLYGGAGRDLFRFLQGDGQDRIGDFDATGTDQLVFLGSGIGSVTWQASAEGTLVRYGQGDTVLLSGVAPAAFSAADFAFA